MESSVCVKPLPCRVKMLWDLVIDMVVLWRYERCCVSDKRTVTSMYAPTPPSD